MNILETADVITREDLSQIEEILMDQARGKLIDTDRLSMLGLLSNAQLEVAQGRAEHIVRLQAIAKSSKERAKDQAELEKLENSVPVRLGIIQAEIAKLQSEENQLRSKLGAARKLVKDQEEAIEKLIEASPVHLRGRQVVLAREKSRADHAIRSLQIELQRMDLMENLIVSPAKNEPVTLRLYAEEQGLPIVFKEVADPHGSTSRKHLGENNNLWTVDKSALPVIKAHRAKLTSQIEIHQKTLERVNADLKPINDYYVPE